MGDQKGKPVTGLVFVLLVFSLEAHRARAARPAVRVADSSQDGATEFTENTVKANAESHSSSGSAAREARRKELAMNLHNDIKALLGKPAEASCEIKDVNRDLMTLKRDIAAAKQMIDTATFETKKMNVIMPRLMKTGNHLTDCGELPDYVMSYVHRVLRAKAMTLGRLAKEASGLSKWEETSKCSVNSDENGTPTITESPMQKAFADCVRDSSKCTPELQAPSLPHGVDPCSGKGAARLTAFGSAQWHSCESLGGHLQFWAKNRQRSCTGGGKDYPGGKNYHVCCCSKGKMQAEPDKYCEQECNPAEAERHRIAQWRINAVAMDTFGADCDYGARFQMHKLATKLRAEMEKALYQDVLDVHLNLTKDEWEQRNKDLIKRDLNEVGEEFRGNKNAFVEVSSRKTVQNASAGASCLSEAHRAKVKSGMKGVLRSYFSDVIENALDEEERASSLSQTNETMTESSKTLAVAGLLVIAIIIFFICFIFCLMTPSHERRYDGQDGSVGDCFWLSFVYALDFIWHALHWLFIVCLLSMECFR